MDPTIYDMKYHNEYKSALTKRNEKGKYNMNFDITLCVGPEMKWIAWKAINKKIK